MVVSARGLARRVVPRRVFEEGSDLLGKGDRDSTARRSPPKLVRLGFARVAAGRGPRDLRGARRHPRPVEPGRPAAGAARVLRRRGGELPRLRPGDAAERGRGPGGAALPGPRGALRRGRQGGGAGPRCARRPSGWTAPPRGCARCSTPSTRARRSSGWRRSSPASTRAAWARSTTTCPPGTVTYVDDAAAVEEALSRPRRGARPRARRGAPARGAGAAARGPLPPRAEAALAAALARPAVRRHRVWLGKEEPIRLALEETAQIRGEIEAAHGRGGRARAAHAAARGLAQARHRRGGGLRHRLRRRTGSGACSRTAASTVRVHTGPARRRRASSTTRPSTRTSSRARSRPASWTPPRGLAVVSDEEIFGARGCASGRAGAKSENAFAAGFRELERGRPRRPRRASASPATTGLTKMQIRGVPGDFLVLAYDGARPALPAGARSSGQVQKFTGGDRPRRSRLDQLGGQSFAKRKERVKEQLLKMAAELLDIYAARAAHPGFAVPRSRTATSAQFEADFEFEETPDQAKAIEDVLARHAQKRAARPPRADGPARLRRRGLRQDRGGDARRLQGRALDGSRWRCWCPPPCSPQQHYRTFRERFKDYPVRIEVVSRMKTAEEVREILKRAAAGQGRRPHRHAPAARRATCPSRTWACWSWTRSSASA